MIQTSPNLKKKKKRVEDADNPIYSRERSYSVGQSSNVFYYEEDIKFGRKSNLSAKRMKLTYFQIYIYSNKSTVPTHFINCKDITRIVKIDNTTHIGVYTSNKKRYIIGLYNEEKFNSTLKLFEDIIEFHQKKPKELTINLYFCDTSCIPIEIVYGQTTAEELWWMICEIFQLESNIREYFFISVMGYNIDILLRNDDVLTDVLENWHEDYESCSLSKYEGPCRFVFKKSFISLSKEKNIKDPKGVHLCYAEEYMNVLKGNYMVGIDLAVELGGLVAQVKHGDFDRTKMMPGFYSKRIVQYIPSYMTRKKSISLSTWENRICEEHKKHAGKKLMIAELLYLQQVRQLPYYGSKFFLGKNKTKGSDAGYFDDGLSGLINIGLNLTGIHIFQQNGYFGSYLWKNISHWETEQDKYFYFIGVKGFVDSTKKKKKYDSFLIETKFAPYIKEYIYSIVYEIKREKRYIEKEKLRQSSKFNKSKVIIKESE